MGNPNVSSAFPPGPNTSAAPATIIPLTGLFDINGNLITAYGPGGVPIVWNGQIHGNTDGLPASAGMVGEVLSASLPSGTPVSMTSGVFYNVVSRTLTPGRWAISGVGEFTPAASTSISLITVGIGTNVTPTQGPGGTYTQLAYATAVPGAYEIDLLTPTVYLNISVTTTYYLVMSGNFSLGTLTCFGNISAIRTS